MRVRYSRLSGTAFWCMVVSLVISLVSYYAPYHGQRRLPKHLSDIPIVSVVVRMPPESYVFILAAVVYAALQIPVAFGFRKVMPRWKNVFCCIHALGSFTLLLAAIIPTGRLVELELYADWEDPAHATCATLWFILWGSCHLRYLANTISTKRCMYWLDMVWFIVFVISGAIFGVSRRSSASVHSCEWIAGLCSLILADSLACSSLRNHVLYVEF